MMSIHFSINIKRRAFNLLCQASGYLGRGYPIPINSLELTHVDNLPDHPLELYFLDAAGLATFSVDEGNAYIHITMDGVTLSNQLQSIEFLNM